MIESNSVFDSFSLAESESRVTSVITSIYSPFSSRTFCYRLFVRLLLLPLLQFIIIIIIFFFFYSVFLFLFLLFLPPSLQSASGFFFTSNFQPSLTSMMLVSRLHSFRFRDQSSNHLQVPLVSCWFEASHCSHVSRIVLSVTIWNNLSQDNNF